ncbi:MAG: flippase, partial [Candidatus Scalindua sp.]
GLGTARFGVLTLAWMVVGYFSLFDLGLGRALTKLVAEKLGAGKDEEIPGIVWIGMSLMSALGVIGAVIIGCLSPWLVGGALEIPRELQPETLTAFYLLAVSIPVVISATGLRGVLEAHYRFGVVNAIRLPLGIFTFLGPLAVLPFSNSLSDIVLVLVLARFISLLAYLIVCLVLYPDLRRRASLGREMAKRLLSFGGWMTVSNITGPLLLYLGRVFIITMLSAEAVAYFVTPYEVVAKLLVIPGVIVSVLFPAFSHSFQSGGSNIGALYKKSLRYIFAIMLPIVLLVYFYAQDGLAWWVNDEFSTNGFRVAQFLAIGVFINSFGHISQALVQGYGRPDLTAKLHLAELLIYIPYLWVLIDQYGITGAAIAWTIRVTISTLALSYLARRCIQGSLSVKY